MLYKIAWVIFLMLVSFIVGVIWCRDLRIDTYERWEKSEAKALAERVEFMDQYILNGCRRVEK